MNTKSTDNTGKSDRVVLDIALDTCDCLYILMAFFEFFDLNLFTTRVHLSHSGRQEQLNIYRACVRLKFDNKVETNIIKLLEIHVLHTNDVKPALFAQSLLQLLSEKDIFMYDCMLT